MTLLSLFFLWVSATETGDSTPAVSYIDSRYAVTLFFNAEQTLVTEGDVSRRDGDESWRLTGLANVYFSSIVDIITIEDG